MTITKFNDLKTDSLVEAQLNKALDKIEELSKESSDNYNRVQNLKGEVAKLEQEKDSLVKLANKRYDEIATLKKEAFYNNDITQANLAESLNDNEKLESEIKDLKTHLRLIAKLSDYESLGYKL